MSERPVPIEQSKFRVSRVEVPTNTVSAEAQGYEIRQKIPGALSLEAKSGGAIYLPVDTIPEVSGIRLMDDGLLQVDDVRFTAGAEHNVRVRDASVLCINMPSLETLHHRALASAIADTGATAVFMQLPEGFDRQAAANPKFIKEALLGVPDIATQIIIGDTEYTIVPLEEVDHEKRHILGGFALLQQEKGGDRKFLVDAQKTTSLDYLRFRLIRKLGEARGQQVMEHILDTYLRDPAEPQTPVATTELTSVAESIAPVEAALPDPQLQRLDEIRNLLVPLEAAGNATERTDTAAFREAMGSAYSLLLEAFLVEYKNETPDLEKIAKMRGLISSTYGMLGEGFIVDSQANTPRMRALQLLVDVTGTSAVGDASHIIAYIDSLSNPPQQPEPLSQAEQDMPVQQEGDLDAGVPEWLRASEIGVAPATDRGDVTLNPKLTGENPKLTGREGDDDDVAPEDR